MIVYLVCYAASLLLALGRHYLLSGAGLLAAAVYLYASDYIRSGNLLHLRGIFALSFVGGQGLACMKLSYLSQAWSAGTWLGLLAAFAGFYLAFYYLEAFSGEASVRVGGHSGAVQRRGLESYAGTVFFCAVALAALRYIRSHPEIVDRLSMLAGYMRRGLKARGVPIIESNTPIIPIYTYTAENTLMKARRVYEKGVYVNTVLPPATAADKCLLRTSYMATLTEELLDEAIEVFAGELAEVSA